MVWDERTDEKVIAKVMDALAAAGFTAADPEPGAPAEESGEETGTPEDENTTSLTVEMPRDTFTEEALINLQKIIDSKATLLKKSLGTEELPVMVTEEKVAFPWFPRIEDDPVTVAAYTHLVSAICEMARNAKRVTATDRPVESEKYAFRVWLLRLGFVGKEFKKERAVLMKNLSGHAAFKNQADADAFYEKQQTRRAERKVELDAENEDYPG